MDERDTWSQLARRVDTFAAEVVAADPSVLRCRRGCDACCHVELTVGATEAAKVREALATLDHESRARVRARAARRDGRCVMLEPDGACAIYEGRPLVCRTQGLALRYPADVVPASRLSARGADGSAIVWCPLNYRDRSPRSSEILDAERVDVIRAAIDHASHGAGAARVSLHDLAAERREG